MTFLELPQGASGSSAATYRASHVRAKTPGGGFFTLRLAAVSDVPAMRVDRTTVEQGVFNQLLLNAFPKLGQQLLMPVLGDGADDAEA
jgi:hypothetical protein